MNQYQEMLQALSEIVADLSRNMPVEARFKRLLDALMTCFPCDATALLQLESDELVPRAVRGLSHETMGRRFVVEEQPRLKEILQSRGVLRFAADSQLPDPYDGLVESEDHHLHVHDCMGAAMHVDGRIWGVLTLDALKAGQFDGIDLPLLDTFVSVAAASIRAAELIKGLSQDLERHQLVLHSVSQDKADKELIGDSPAMNRLRREAEMVGRSDLPVLIQGETGTGKELVSHFIHLHSPRSDKIIVHVNCAALPDSLAESELFGHTAGAFSGAMAARAGKFELADQGTLLLDEIGELPLALQATLLRALQSGEIQRVGSDQLHTVNVRVIAATNRNLEQEVAAGRFRADLYHRLSVYPITIPPLRDRADDILQLAGHFLQLNERRYGLRTLRLAPDASRWLKEYNWPGNVRELEHVLARATIRATARQSHRQRVTQILREDLGQEMPSTSITRAIESAPVDDVSFQQAIEQYKYQLISQRFQAHQHNVAETARSLNLDRGNLYRMIKRMGIK